MWFAVGSIRVIAKQLFPGKVSRENKGTADKCIEWPIYQPLTSISIAKSVCHTNVQYVGTCTSSCLCKQVLNHDNPLIAHT